MVGSFAGAMRLRGFCAAGARMRECYDKQAKERMQAGQERGGAISGRGRTKNSSVENLPPTNHPDRKKTRDVVGKLVGVSGKTIDHAVKEWMLRRQLARRNLTDAMRVKIALVLKPILEEKAKQNKPRPKASSSLVNLPANAPKVDVREEIAKAAGVSGRTVDKVETVLAKADEPTKTAMLNDGFLKDREPTGRSVRSISGIDRTRGERQSCPSLKLARRSTLAQY